MKAEIKYIAILYVAHMIALPAIMMMFAGHFEPKVIIPMAILGICTSTLSLWILMLWVRSENVMFMTKDTIVDGVVIGNKEKPSEKEI